MSLRARLMALLVALCALGLLIVGSVSYAALRDYLSKRVDKQAISALQEISRRFSHQGFGPGYGPFGGPPPNTIPDGSYGELRDQNGAVIQDQNFSFRGNANKPTIPGDIPKTTDRDHPRTLDRGRYRFISAATEGGGSLVAAVPLGDYTSTLHRLVVVELIVAAAVLAALAAAAFWLVRLGLAPLERMGRTAGAIAAGDLTKRVEPATQRTEVGRLGLALNRMLVQIETAFAERTQSEERLRRFLSDASHELRTPLASIRGYAELYRIGVARTPADQEKAMTRIEAEAKRMGVLVDDLLTLARMDEERELRLEEVDLRELAGEAVDAARAAAPDRDVTLDANGPVLVEGDPGRLRQVIDNLVRNALTHTPEGTAVELRVGRSEDRAQLDVRDHGRGLPAGTDPDALFERFWRSEGGRERGKAGAGLGLAIVAGIVDAHRGEVSAANAPGGGARFMVSLPLSEPPAAS